MKKWIGYLVVGIIFFLVGFMVSPRPSLPGAEEPVQSKERVSGEQDWAEPRVQEEASFALDDMPVNIADLNQHLAAMNPSLYTRVKSELEGETFSVMLEALFETNPAGAAALLANASDQELGANKTSLYLKLARQWSESDPHAALVWVLAQKEAVEPSILNGSLAYIAANYAKVDPEQSLALLESISDESMYEMTRHEIAVRWVDHDQKGAFEWLEMAAEQGMPNKIVTEYYSDMMKKFIAINPFEAAGLVGQLTSSELRPNLSAHVAAELSQVDLQAAMNWVQTLSDDESRMAGIQEIVNMQQSIQPEKVVNFLLTQPAFTEQTAGLLGNAFEMLAFQDDAYARDLLQRLPETAQSKMAESVTYGLLSKDEKTAMDWINAQSPGKILDGAASVMAVERIESDPIGAIDWAKKIGDQTRRNKVLRDLAINAEAKDLPAIQSAMGQTNLSKVQMSVIQGLITDRLKDEFAAYAMP